MKESSHVFYDVFLLIERQNKCVLFFHPISEKKAFPEFLHPEIVYAAIQKYMTSSKNKMQVQF